MSLKQIKAFVERIRPLTDSIIELVLSPEQYLDYKAGQYAQIRSGLEYLSYSIANAPLGSQTYEFHIRHNQGNPYDQPLFAEIKAKGAVDLRLPLGNCHIDRLDPKAPILFLAAGTGFAPIKAMIEQLLATGDPRSFELYWSARSQSDLYMSPIVQQWQAHVNQLHYCSLVSTNSLKTNFADLILQRHKSRVHRYQIVISGPFDIAYATRDALLSQGIAPSRLFSDAFDFE